MDNHRELIDLSMFLQQEDDDDDDVILATLNAILIRRRQRHARSRHPIVNWMLRRNKIRQILGPTEQFSIPGFCEIVWRYGDVQFIEDFRMPRQRFEVSLI